MIRTSGLIAGCWRGFPGGGTLLDLPKQIIGSN